LHMGIGDATLGLTVTFPTAFSNVPMVIVCLASANDQTVRIHSIAEAASQFDITLNRDSAAAAIDVIIRWHAEGPE